MVPHANVLLDSIALLAAICTACDRAPERGGRTFDAGAQSDHDGADDASAARDAGWLLDDSSESDVAGGQAASVCGFDSPMPPAGCGCTDGRFWEADFSTDPTALELNGDGLADWRLRSDSPFPVHELSAGVWGPTVGTALDTQPEVSFDGATYIRLRYRDTTEGGSGAVFWINVDASENAFASIHADLSLQSDGTQTLTLFGRDDAGNVELTRYAGLASGMVDLALTVDADSDQVRVWIDDTYRGTYACPRRAGSDARFATLLGWSSEAAFDWVRIEACPGSAQSPIDPVIDPVADPPTCDRPSLPSPPAAYFVSSLASASGDGSETSPFARLEQARDAIRALGSLPAGGVTVYLRAGSYERRASFSLTAEDSGSADAPIRYAAYPCEVPQIIGGKQVRGWQPLTSGAIYERLPAIARGKVYLLDLPAQGISDYGTFVNRHTKGTSGPWLDGPAPLELFVDGTPQNLARYPNVDAAGDDQWLFSQAGTANHTLVYEGTRPTDRNWRGDAAHGNPIMLRGYLHFHYFDGKSSADMGAVYWGYADPGTRGIAIRYNIIGDTYRRSVPWNPNDGLGYGVPCLYTDGGGSGGDLSLNLLYNCDYGILSNSGKFHHITNNVIVDMGQSRRQQCNFREPPGTYHDGMAGFIEHKIHERLWELNVRDWTDHADPWTPDISWAEQLAPWDTLAEAEAAMAVNGGVGYRSSGIFSGNIVWRSVEYWDDTYGPCEWEDNTNNLIVLDPENGTSESVFVDEGGGDYRLRADSPAAMLDPAFPIDDWNNMLQVVGPQPR